MPFIEEALEWAKKGVATGASERNWKGYGKDVVLPAGAPEWQQKLITDPQTSGGLLVACSPDAEAAVLEEFRKHGFAQAKRIGSLSAGAAQLRIS